MPLWIYNRPPEKCQENEIRFAQVLNAALSDSWIVRWGYWYTDNQGTLREGDFLVLGPHGGLAVFEVKSGLNHNAATGAWTTEDRDNPVVQLQAQHRGVLNHLQSVAGQRRLPFVTQSLVLPAVDVAPAIPEYRGVPRQLILAANDLRSFQTAWKRLFGAPQAVEVTQKDVFIEAYGEGLNPRSIKAFISETDQLILRQATTSYRLLDLLAGNRQLVVEGGVGTGKSWYAVEQARRLAENTTGEAGRDVLIVAYNLALCRRLRRTVADMRPSRGSLRVESAENLAAAILEACGLDHEPPLETAARQQYFDHVLPQLALEAVATQSASLDAWLGRFDALVVDEAQDHDTSLLPAGEAHGTEAVQPAANLGWWSLYAALLREGWASPISMFGDVAQRPPFRPSGRFRLDLLRARLDHHAHVRLVQPLRYTRQIRDFLLSLEAEGTESLVGGLPRAGQLAEGPEVEEYDTSSDQAAATVERVLARWHSSGQCPPARVLVLYDRSRIERSALAGTESLANHRLVAYAELQENPQPNALAHCSIHKAKGLDALGVVLVVPGRFDHLERPPDRFTYFMGASRARQLLACVHVSD